MDTTKTHEEKDDQKVWYFDKIMYQLKSALPCEHEWIVTCDAIYDECMHCDGLKRTTHPVPKLADTCEHQFAVSFIGYPKYDECVKCHGLTPVKPETNQ